MVAMAKSPRSLQISLTGTLFRWPVTCLLCAAALLGLVWMEMIAMPDVGRCFDPDVVGRYPSSSCSCPDPLVQYRPSDRYWKAQHDRMVFHAEHPPADLDFVMIGDSLVEKLNGTESKGRVPLPEHQQIFSSYFMKSAGADMQGLALGCAADASTQLFFHLRNGLLHGRLRPKVFIVMVGMSDMEKFGCSKTNALKGILNAAEYIASRRPEAKVVIHGLLPRSDEIESEASIDYLLGHVWHDIQWINSELRTFVANKQEEDIKNLPTSQWHYMDMTREFTRRSESGLPISVNSDLIANGVNPSLVGYQVWSDHIKATVSSLL